MVRSKRISKSSKEEAVCTTMCYSSMTATMAFKVRRHNYRADDTLPKQCRSYCNVLKQCCDNANESMDISDDITPS